MRVDGSRLMRDLPRPDDLLELFEIDRRATGAPETGRAEPVLAVAPFVAGVPETGRLDPARATAVPERPPRAFRRSALPLGLVGSLGVHLLPLLVLLNWNSAPAEIPPPIAVRLVEAPPEPPPQAEKPPPQAEKPPPPGRLASDDFGDRKAQPAERAADQPRETVPAEPAPAEMQLAALPPPKPMPPPELVSALPKPAPPPEPATAPQETKPRPLFDAPVKLAAVGRLAPNPRPAPRAPHPGPAATRDAYLAYCMTLIRDHFGMLGPAFLAGRRGATVLDIQVLGDGTIARIAVAQRSPYPDIDERIERAVAAVGRFPPVPQWFQGPKIGLTLHVAYPDGL
jgi:TonB family protein